MKLLSSRPVVKHPRHIVAWLCLAGLALGLGFAWPAPAQANATVSITNSNPRSETLFDDGWLFHRGGALGAQEPGFNDSDWRLVDLPHDWSVEDLPGTSSPFSRDAISQVNGGFTTGGSAWYRKAFVLPSEMKGKRVVFQFDGIYMNAEVWLNGAALGRHPYGYTSFSIDVSGQVRFDATNVVSVKVQNEGENSRWYSGSGIYRHVWLRTLDTVHVAQWGTSVTTPAVTEALAQIEIQNRVVNESGEASQLVVVSHILDPKRVGSRLGSIRTIYQTGGNGRICPKR